MTLLHYAVVEFDVLTLTYERKTLENVTLKNDKIYWIHCDLSQKDELPTIAKALNLPEHIVELCTKEDTSQKVIDTGSDLTLQMSCVLQDKPNEQYEIKEGNMLIYLTERYCFTASQTQQPSIYKFQQIYHKNLKFASTPGFIVFLLLDSIINDYSSVLEEYERIADNKDILVHEVHKGVYSEVMAIKKQVTKVKRYAAALRYVLMRISGRKISVISEPFRVSLCGLFDHTQMLVNQADAVRETLNGTLDLIENLLMQKMNATMRILTSISAIFLPLSVLLRINEEHYDWVPTPTTIFRYGIVFVCLALLTVSIPYFYKKIRRPRI